MTKSLPFPTAAATVRGLPLLVQVLLHLWTTCTPYSGVPMDENIERAPVHLCDVCLQTFSDASLLTQHLQKDHGLAGISFNVARDSLDSQAACAHCGTTYSSMESLRSHISQGRCSSFNPAATAETAQISQVYKRSSDLANHLMTSHARLWRLDKVPFMPIQISEEVMQMLSNACIMCGQAHHPGLLCRHLHEAHTCGHQFADFYNETLMPVFKTQMTSDFHCDYCKQYFNMPPDHATPEASDARQLLVQVHLQGNCPVLLQASLLLGTALNGGRLGYEWLGRASNDRDQRNVCLPGPGLRQDLAVAPQPTGNEATQDGHHQQGRQDRSRSTRQRAAQRDHGMPENPGTASSASRAQSELAAKHRLFRALLPTGPIRLPPGLVEGDTEMATASTERPRGSDSAVATAPLPMVDERPPDQSPEGIREQAGRRAPTDLPGPEDCARGHELALSPMGSTLENPDDRQEESSIYEKDAGAHGGALRGHAAPGTDSALPGSAHDLSPGCSPLEATDQHATRQDLRSLGCTGTQFGLDAGGNIAETASAQAVFPDQCPDSADVRQQGPGQGRQQRQIESQASQCLTEDELHQLRKLTSTLMFINESNWCFANVTVHCLLWSLLSLSDAETKMWGKHHEILFQTILTSQHAPVKLIDFSWFSQVLELWGRPQAQQDCGEFIHTMLQWLTSPAFNMLWEHRCEQNGTVLCHDHGDCNMPLFLQFSRHDALATHCKLDQLVSTWHQEHGMPAALTIAAPLLCLHIDRLFEGSTGQIEKSSCAIDIESEVTVPVFHDAALTCTNISYVLIAAAAHLGRDEEGHYQAILKIQPMVTEHSSPAKWLLTQDNMRPCPLWRIPEVIMQNMNIVWLIRSDCIQLPQYHPCPAEDPAPDTTQQLLALLSSATKQPMAPSDAIE